MNFHAIIIMSYTQPSTKWSKGAEACRTLSVKCTLSYRNYPINKWQAYVLSSLKWKHPNTAHLITYEANNNSFS